jgi:two-component system, NarL family, sensor histidine kinase UhpB
MRSLRFWDVDHDPAPSGSETRNLRLLLLEDDEEYVGVLLRELRRGGYSVEHTRVTTQDELREVLTDQWDCVICDWELAELAAAGAIELVRDANVDAPIIVVSGSVGKQDLANAMRAGADEYVLKENLARLVPSLERELRQVTNRRTAVRTEHSLAESEARYQRLIETIPAATYIIVPSAEAESGYTTTYMSPQIAQIVGYTPEEICSNDGLWTSLIDPRDRQRVIAADKHHLRTGLPISIEYRVTSRDGHVVWIHDAAERVYGDHGVTSQGFVTDASILKRAEAHLYEAEGRLRTADSARQLLLSRLVSAQEEERQGIAADIHDDPLQQLYAATIRLGMLADRLTLPQDIEAAERVNGLIDSASRTLRRMLFELQPHALESDGLGQALEQYTEYTNAEGGTRYRVEDGLTVQPSIEMRIVAYRVALESISNIRKHAEAEHASISLEERSQMFVCRVADDGRGFDTAAAYELRPGHLGLPAMRERVELAGGSLTLTSAPGNGTVVEASLPRR